MVKQLALSSTLQLPLAQTVEVGAVAPADVIAPSPRSYHTYYTPSSTYANFRFIRVQELTEIQH